MARRSISIDEKINQQKQIVFQTNDKYDAAAAELEKLMIKRVEVRQKELHNAFVASNKTFEEVMSFLWGGSPEEQSATNGS